MLVPAISSTVLMALPVGLKVKIFPLKLLFGFSFPGHLSIVCNFELSSHSSSLIAYLSLLFFLFLFLGDTKVLVAVYGPKAGTKKNENPEKACIEVIWKPKSGQIGEFCICLYCPTIIWSMFTYYNIICLLLQWG